MSVIRSLIVLQVLSLATTVCGEEQLPRVLILGDSIYDAPARSVALELKGRVDVEFASLQPGEVRNTHAALENLDALLGDGDWDLIHFNFGLGDLVYRAPGMKSFRVFPKLAGGVRTTSPQQFEQNLHAIAKRLKATGARLVWASITPIRSTPHGIFDAGSEIEYNVIANKVMATHSVPINDMYTHVASLIDMQRPAPHGMDPFYFDKQPLHPPIVKAVLEHLNRPTAP